MRKFCRIGDFGLFLVLVMLLAVLPFGALADPDPEPAPVAQPQMTGILPAGGWVGYTFDYAGDFAKVGIILDYDPSDDPNDIGKANGEQVTLAVYSPASPPPDGKPIAWAGGNHGQKQNQLEAPLGGIYVLVLNNWDSLGRPVNFTVSTVAGGVGDPATAPAGPPLRLVGSSAPLEGQLPADTGAGPGAVAAAQFPGKRVGIQAGHWRSAELPAELARLRTSTGTSGGGLAEWQYNLDIARRVAALLEARGVAADVLPATIPAGYKADAFVALHCDGDKTGKISGFKLAQGRWSGVPALDKALLDAITVEYQAATRLPTDWKHVSRNMTGYYAFSNRNYKHAVARGTPAVIVEMGFMTNASDLKFLLGNRDTVAQGIANGIMRFLNQR